MESGTNFNAFVAALVKKPDMIIVNDALDPALLKAAVLGDFSLDSYKNLWVRQNPLKPIVYPSTATFLGSDDSHMTNNYADAAKRAEGSDFRVLSYNLLHGEWGGFHESLRKDAVIDVIRHLSPDVMGLQEITGEWYRHLGEAFKGRYRWAEVPDSLHNLMYNALMYNERKFRQVDGGVIPFQNDLRLRSIHWMLLEEHESKRRMIVANTHWFGQPELQTLAADVMVKEIASLRKTYDVPVFIAGDYNATYKDAAFDRLLALSGLNDSFVASGNKENSTTRSWVDNNFNEVPARNSLHIDHIVFGGAAKIVGAHLVYKKSLMDASDHLPLVADFKLPAAKAKAELD